MSNTVIKTEGLGKKYIISHEAQEKYTALRDVIHNKTKDLFRKRIQTTKEEFWALKDINFEIKSGEVIGIIGRNGAGKSTLLKILSRITEPTAGCIEINGRISSLLEVGTGFHPELTGRENIFLNGAVLGMGRAEIKKKFDAIVDFSGVEKFLDTPVKRYSSGMYLRLAFAVAAHLEPEILIVDEVLAVGDAEFQKKCLGKMDEVSKNEGRTVLFVSHDMAAIHQLCTKLFYLKEGRLDFEGDVDKGINIYTDSTRPANDKRDLVFEKRVVNNKKAYIAGFDVKLADDNKKIQISIFIRAADLVEKTEIAVGVNDSSGNRIATFHSRFFGQQFNLEKGVNEFICSVNHFFLKPGVYNMNVFLGNKYETFDYLDEPVDFELQQSVFYPAGIVPDNSQGYLMADYSWTLKTAAHAGS
jgi:lipopolysaccharide transport system ATP-binding protein